MTRRGMEGEVAGNILDLEALGAVHLEDRPFPWATYAGAFTRSPPTELFPDDGFEKHTPQSILEAIGKKGSDAWFQHNVDTRALLELGKTEPHAPSGLAPFWLELAEELASPAYRECLSEATRHDLRLLQMQAHFWRYKAGSFFQPHVDKPHKVVTHLIYLSKNWSPEDGGGFRVLSSGDADDVFAEVPPLEGHSVLLRWSENAWHTVSPIPRTSKYQRRTLQIWFWQPQ